MTSRRILRLSGSDTRTFLQGMISNDIDKINAGLVYAALLTPQGKYIADFFVSADGADVLLDTDSAQTDALIARLNMYKLRADVQIDEADLHVHRGLADVPVDGFLDPRHDALGWRAYRATPATDDVDWTAIEVAHVIPTSGIELTSDTFILEVGFERLNGVDFRKGCYVGQEVTARMKHKTELRKGLAQVQVTGAAETGTPIEVDGKPAGTLLSRSGDLALAYLRYDRARGPMQAGNAQVVWHDK
ncbi:YgfZ/GcvT domain-containing protein [Pseudosulfitobacter sp. SM2401]|uniref:CAF17-like 4Fe-4S cluster assembly/insertion protein YgfZ n=1 Tax=Pseudosulfitobacter sp. SM2401 TaxID=3350098 RepID=UPI0036F2563D